MVSYSKRRRSRTASRTPRQDAYYRNVLLWSFSHADISDHTYDIGDHSLTESLSEMMASNQPHI